jgi:hypothetical protein
MEPELDHGETKIYARVQALGGQADQGSRLVLCAGRKRLGVHADLRQGLFADPQQSFPGQGFRRPAASAPRLRAERRRRARSEPPHTKPILRPEAGGRLAPSRSRAGPSSCWPAPTVRPCSRYSRFCAPSTLMSRGGKDLVKRLPKAERAVTDGDFRGDLQPTAFRRHDRRLPGNIVS